MPQYQHADKMAMISFYDIDTWTRRDDFNAEIDYMLTIAAMNAITPPPMPYADTSSPRALGQPFAVCQFI